jgi:adenylate cyclase
MPGDNSQNSSTSQKKRRSLRSWLQLVGISLGISLLVLLLTQDIFFTFGPLERLELSTIDMRFRYRGLLNNKTDVIIVEINSESFKTLPDKYPWPRSYYARLVRNLYRAGARAIGFDVVFSEPDAKHLDGDEDFRKAIRETGIVVVGGKTETSTEQYIVKSADENYGNIFYDADSSIGIVLVRNDEDNIMRRYRPFTYDRAAERRIPTLSFATLNKYFKRPQFFTAENTPTEFLYEGRTIPKADPVSMYVNYYGPDRTYPHIRIADVLDDEEFKTKEELELESDINTFDDPDMGYLYDGTFKDKIVLVGSTEPEEKDMFAIPLAYGRETGDNLMYGVEIHANVIQNVLDDNFLYREPQWLDILVIIILCAITFIGLILFKEVKFRRSSISELLSILFVLIELGLIGYISMELFSKLSYVTTMTHPSLAVVFGFAGATIYNYITERKQKTLIKGMFSTYVNPTLVNELIDNPEKMRLGGERKELTVMFSDIEGFTSVAESMKPEELVEVLNDYLSLMTNIIFSSGGTVDKFEGDAIMAFWGAPIDQPDHALRACQGSLDMMRALNDIRDKWVAEGRPKINIRIGLNSGNMIVGNMGGTGRFDYTVIGDSVNLGSRLEGANKQYRTRIMIGQRTHELVKDHIITRELDMLVVVGKTEPIRVYELIGMKDGQIDPKLEKFLDLYSKGLTLYRSREWTSAIEHFEKAIKLKPDDYPSQIYVERSNLYIMTPPPDDWNGVFILRSK